MENDRTQIVDRLKQSTNVLITVNSNPTVDQLAACIGVTLLLNKMGKHATAVFSGKVPSTIEFLKPEETLEKNTDSLRDFIIALDKAKADKLRYKVEDTMVKIFITPYKTSISDKDLEFSQGDFNIDVILALGIHDREQIDQAIMAHGRILHDAVIMTVDSNAGSNLGTINWVEEQASSLCEMLASVVDDLQSNSCRNRAL
jgi:nanoRNase/pAp phosphatase (c-di-AMP/oligoRNAs hydrolase)